MLIAGVSRQGKAEQELVDPHAEWAAMLARLRADLARSPPPRIGQLTSYVQLLPEGQRHLALLDVVAEHLRSSWKEGRGFRIEDYAQSLPALVELAIPPDLVEDEFLARHQFPHGDCPSLAEYENRFSSRPEIVKWLARRCLNGGRYVKLRKLGRGAMSDVWEALDRQEGMRIAVKEPRRGRGDLLRWECAVTARLDHPCIFRVQEHSLGDELFYVMRLANGQTLATLIHHYHQFLPKPNTEEQKLHWTGLLLTLMAACDAVAYAHSQGVVHGDLKPGNVMVGPYGQTVILDWGLAKLVGEEAAFPRQGGRLAGTPEYMAPEQAEGQSSFLTDVFGLGGILYEMLTGQPPHGWVDGRRPLDWRESMKAAAIPPPRRLNPHSPRGLDAVCRKSLARQPEDRYSSAADLALDLRRHLAGLPVAAPGGTSWLRSWLGRGPGRLAGATDA